MAFRFLHLADVHLDTHFGGRPRTRERLRSATHEAFGRAVDYALREGLHAVLIAGDLFDDPILSLKTELELVRHVERLTAAGVWVLYCCGNHDPGAHGRRAPSLGLERPSVARGRVHLFRRTKPETVVITDPSGKQVGVVIGAGHGSDHESANLAATFPRLDTELPVVGLLHTQIETARAAEEHDRYAPSIPADYAHAGYAYWALGHVHIRQQAVPDLPVWYSGNLQGRNPRERGPKGGLVVEAHPGGFATPSFVPFAPVRWEQLEITDLEDLSSIGALADLLQECIEAERQKGGEELALRLILKGPTPLAARLKDAGERKQLEEHLIARGSALEVLLDTRAVRKPRDLEALTAAPTVLQAVGDALAAIERGDLRVRDLPLAPLANTPDEDAEETYLKDLLIGLHEELIERCLEEDA